MGVSDTDGWMSTGDVARLTGLSVFGVRKAAKRLSRKLKKPGLIRKEGRDLRLSPEIADEILANADRLMVVDKKPDRKDWCVFGEYDVPRGTLFSMFQRGELPSVRYAGVRYYWRKGVEEQERLRKVLLSDYKSITDAALELGVNRNTVRKYIDLWDVPTHKYYRKAKKTMVHMPTLRRIIAKNRDKIRWGQNLARSRKGEEK